MFDIDIGLNHAMRIAISPLDDKGGGAAVQRLVLLPVTFVYVRLLRYLHGLQSKCDSSISY